MALIGKSSNKSFTTTHYKMGLYGLIAAHLQFVLGVVLFFLGSHFVFLKENGMGAVMKDSVERLFVVEHPMMNIIAVVLITIGWSKHKKKTTDSAKFGSIGVMYLIGALLLLSRIPFSNWLGL